MWKIQRERERLTGQLKGVDTDLGIGEKAVGAHLALLHDAYALQMAADDENKRRLNQMTFEAIFISDADVTVNEIYEPYDSLYPGQEAFDARIRRSGQGSHPKPREAT
ncbi:hypothetical protein [Gryllotalpicola protaetiae]|uniref:Uncharacterized protein n=1 Tax=Gryllotalpicola protaetiae TaxID=2419771 RepID=A0A387BJM5_9MICO|nr:hypothetical protein [Gryllotalpicola protaetiae]AYG02452.1 hypothetical protein D7I44_02150 [Gryllotalpicola protaetiae]